MKKLQNLKIYQLEKAQMSKRELQFLRGGGTPGDCRCGCNGPSSLEDNFLANKEYGYTETYGGAWCCSCATLESLNTWYV
jgi:natural product precursor